MPRAGTQSDSLRWKLAGVEIQQHHVVGTISGVAVLAAAARNGPGTGRLRSYGDGTELTWLAPGSSTEGSRVACDQNGAYLLPDGEDRDKWLRVQVYADYLTPGPAESRVFLADVYNAMGPDDATAAEASGGAVTTHTVELENVGTGTVSHLRVWLAATATGLELSADGSTWSTPGDEAHGVSYPDIAPGDSVTLHVRRSIPADSASDPDVLNHLHSSFSAL